MVKNLKLLRNEKNVSQQQLADILGISQQSVNKYENKDTEPDIETLIKIANYFNTSVDFLIGNTEIRRKIEKTSSNELNKNEENFIKKYRLLDKDEKQSIDLILKNYCKK